MAMKIRGREPLTKKQSELLWKLLAQEPTKGQLLTVNSYVVEKIRGMERALALTFKLGEKVWFRERHGIRIEGTIVGLNRSTASVEPTGGGPSWRVGWSLLQRTEPIKTTKRAGGYHD
jgi:hypothetical protein